MRDVYKVTRNLPSLESVFQKVKQCFLHHVCHLYTGNSQMKQKHFSHEFPDEQQRQCCV